jgi:hypothetical protein
MLPLPLTLTLQLEAALENFPARKQKKFWFHVRKKNRSQKTSQRTIRATPKIGNFHFRRWLPIST